MLLVEMRPIGRLIPFARNARTHSADQVAQIAASIAEFGFVNPVLIGPDDVIVAGHGRVMAAERLGLAEVPVIVLRHLTDAQRRAYVIADNKLALNASWNEALLAAEIADLRVAAVDLDLLGFAEDELGRLLDDLASDQSHGEQETQGGESQAASGSERSTLAERFGIPPFSVLDARKGWWQDRKRAWIDLGIRSELGRGAAPGGSPRPLDRGWTGSAVPGGSPLPAADYAKSKARGDGRGRAMPTGKRG
jgi:hypothetical protein